MGTFCSLILLLPALVKRVFIVFAVVTIFVSLLSCENDLSGQTYLYRIIYCHLQILANTPNIMGTLRSAEYPRNIERITSSKTFSLRLVYSKPLGRKLRIVKLVREMKKKIGSFTWAVLYLRYFLETVWNIGKWCLGSVLQWSSCSPCHPGSWVRSQASQAFNMGL